ncbi:hypothetical protein [Methylobacterium nonmethylotrophicum]|uniref:hypothetical protein n=1 Tax=Methylobacterium nonmethylotrophicum TaxID=1141884 RepID=UPI0014367C3D|nr:hypothetical protein [Methylobacterium nonmethylotrophicum]
MNEASTPETGAERVTRELAEALDRVTAGAADEADAHARFTADISATIARLKARESSTTERTA